MYFYYEIYEYYEEYEYYYEEEYNYVYVYEYLYEGHYYYYYEEGEIEEHGTSSPAHHCCFVPDTYKPDCPAVMKRFYNATCVKGARHPVYNCNTLPSPE